MEVICSKKRIDCIFLDMDIMNIVYTLQKDK